MKERPKIWVVSTMDGDPVIGFYQVDDAKAWCRKEANWGDDWTRYYDIKEIQVR